MTTDATHSALQARAGRGGRLVDVAFPIDTSQPFLRPTQLEALVRAVVAAGEHDEHDWIEWKSELDLAQGEGVWHVSKQILGFSNRTVPTSQRNAAGHGYVVVGAAPGQLIGVTTVDPAILTKAVDRYVGAAGWTPETLRVDGREVLIAVVDPPVPGSAAFPLMKGYDKLPAGAILVRSPGRTEQATPAQIAALFDRARAGGPSLDLVVRAVPSTVEHGPTLDHDALDHLVDKERASLLPVVAPDHPSAAALEYQNQVTEYLEEFRAAALHDHLHRRYERFQAQLHLVIDNPTDRNFADVEVIVELDEDARSWPEDQRELVCVDTDWPQPPHRPSGTRPPWLGFQPPPPPIDPTMFYLSSEPGYVAAEDDARVIVFDDVDLRPEGSVSLPSVPLRVRAAPGSELVIHWKATAANVDGLRTGHFTVVVEQDGLEFTPGRA